MVDFNLMLYKVSFDCIGGWSWVCPPYIESAIAHSDQDMLYKNELHKQNIKEEEEK